MPRHLLVTNDFPPKVGGIQSYLWELWSRLDPDTFVVLTARSHPDADDFDRAQRARGIRIERVPGQLLYVPTPSLRRRIDGLAESVGASLVLLDPVLPLGALGPSLAVPYGVVLHGAEAAVPARLPGSAHFLGHVLRRAALVVSAGRYPAAEAARLLAGDGTASGRGGSARRARGPLHVEVPPGVDTATFLPLEPAARPGARARLGVPAAGPLVASVSRLVPRKGMDVLVEAAARLAPSFPELTVAIAGSGRESARLDAQVRRSGAPVRLLGTVGEQEKAALLGASDVFAMACRRRWGGLEQEGFGIVFVEAAAAGTPQVAGDSGGAAEAVVDGETGIVVPRPEDPGAVAGALRRLLLDEGLRAAMGRAGRARAVSELDHDVVARRLARALAEVQG